MDTDLGFDRDLNIETFSLCSFGFSLDDTFKTSPNSSFQASQTESGTGPTTLSPVSPMYLHYQKSGGCALSKHQNEFDSSSFDGILAANIPQSSVYEPYYLTPFVTPFAEIYPSAVAPYPPTPSLSSSRTTYDADEFTLRSITPAQTLVTQPITRELYFSEAKLHSISPKKDPQQVKRNHDPPAKQIPSAILKSQHLQSRAVVNNSRSKFTAVEVKNQFVCRFPGCVNPRTGRPIRFKRPEHRKRHEITIHEKGMHPQYECWVKECRKKGRAFTRFDNLKAHEKKTHGKKSENKRNCYVATLDVTSMYYDPEWRGELTGDGLPINHPRFP